MPEPQFIPHKITKPIQLLAAWLAGLAIVNGSFLAGAGTIKSPSWISGLLVIAAVLNVPLFILSLFLLQTKFRPEMQEDTFYSKYLERKYSKTSAQLTKPIDLEKQFRTLADDILRKISGTTQNQEEHVVEILKESEIKQLMLRFGHNRTLSEIYLKKETWNEIVDEWKNDPSFEREIVSLLDANLVSITEGNLKQAKLTTIGVEVANRLEQEGKLWHQTAGLLSMNKKRKRSNK